VRAARALLKLGVDSPSVSLRVARVLATAGRPEEALQAYGVFLESGGSEALPPPDVLRRAELLLRVGRLREAAASAEALVEDPDTGVAVGALRLLAEVRRGEGRVAAARALEEELMERFPARPEAVQVARLRGDRERDGGRPLRAAEWYRRAAELAPELDGAGLARMRWGEALLAAGRPEEALEVYGSYLGLFPGGRRRLQAGFWAGRILLLLGRREEAAALLEDVVSRDPLSYYALRASELLDREPPIPLEGRLGGVAPPPGEEMAALDALLAAELPGAADWLAGVLAARLRPSAEGLLGLALELNRRGLTRQGVSLGWEVRAGGEPWSRELLEAVFPFPYRGLVEAEARERGLDLWLVAGLVRQESAFWTYARSRADARGLMQLLPSTARALARAGGPEAFRVDHLDLPEVNLHLGAAFLSDLLRRFRGADLAHVLAAYNAGPTRARRWLRLPEAEDPLLFVERIPFRETREYVKSVLRNRYLYAVLYGLPGDGSARPASPAGAPVPPTGGLP